ncbi:MAG: TonB-dependent receptor [Sphingomonas sp.]|uniref:TonB-dependent receptor n=1 Tax=Sphingomonas sp. TaxID=28214 RepID=UPI0022751378|nr:TonB-dependent receptor [Sphingomonas sp.]MCX8476309.1 TonB-dependent receptor [Sphingomonas sp.]
MSQGAPAASQDTPEPSDQDAQDAIVVTGRRAALQAADERKRNSETIIDSVVSDEAGKLPDNSITEVLQRVAGVTIVRFAALGDPDHFSVEGSGVQVRGLSGVASRLNGREIFSANNGRALLWGDVTPELMAAVDVYKASTADLIEGGTGGQIDLRTKLPFDYSEGWHFAATGELSMGDLAQKADMAGSGLIAGRWSTPIGDIGILADVAYSQFSSSSQFFRMEPYFRTTVGGASYFIPGGFDYGEERFQRKRSGIYGAVQWAPSDALTLTGTFFQSRYKNKLKSWGSFVTSQTLGVDPATSKFDSIGGLLSSDSVFTRDTGTFLPNGSAINSGGNSAFSKSDSLTRDYALSFEWAPSDSPLAIRGAIQRVDSTANSDALNIFRDVAFPSSFGLDLTGNLPQVTLPQSATTGFDNPANYFWTATMPNTVDNTGRLDSANLDLEYKFGDGFFKSVKIGGRWAERTERDLNTGFNWSALGRGWNGSATVNAPQLTFANAAPGDIEKHVFKDFFRGGLPVPANLMFPSQALVGQLDRDLVHRAPPVNFCGPFDWGNATYFNCSSAGPLPASGYGGPGYTRTNGAFVLPQDQTDYLTRTWAGYALVRFGQEDGLGISGNVGVRVVRVENRSSGYYTQGANQFFRDGTLVTLPERSAVVSNGAKFTRFLPSVNLSFAPSESTKIRAGYNITMDNASFSALRASGGLGVTTVDNPNNPTDPNAPRLPPIFVNFTTNSGNPTLKPTMSNNFDLSFEWYPRAGTTFHVAAFYKHISNLPIYTLTQQPVTVHYADGSSSEELAAATDAANAVDPAKIKGIEIGGRAFFDMLPGLLSGLGIEANYTFIDSKNPGDLYRDIDGVSHNDAPVQGMSRHNFNVSLMYERNPISFRVAYSWRSKYLQSTNSNGTNPQYSFFSGPGVSRSVQIALPVYGDAYGTLDAGVRFKVTENFSFSVQGTNLLNATARTLMGGYPDDTLYVRSWFQSDRRISTGINLAF